MRFKLVSHNSSVHAVRDNTKMENDMMTTLDNSEYVNLLCGQTREFLLEHQLKRKYPNADFTELMYRKAKFLYKRKGDKVCYSNVLIRNLTKGDVDAVDMFEGHVIKFVVYTTGREHPDNYLAAMTILQSTPQVQLVHGSFMSMFQNLCNINAVFRLYRLHELTHDQLNTLIADRSILLCPMRQTHIVSLAMSIRCGEEIVIYQGEQELRYCDDKHMNTIIIV